MFKLHKKTIKTIVSIIKSQNNSFQEQLYAKYVNGFSDTLPLKHNWEKFMEFDLIENDYDDFLNEILNNVNTQDKNLVPEKIQNALEEIGYDFKMYDGMYRICIRDSKCVIYLTKENDMVLVNKRLCKFQYIDQKIFAREKNFYIICTIEI